MPSINPSLSQITPSPIIKINEPTKSPSVSENEGVIVEQSTDPTRNPTETPTNSQNISDAAAETASKDDINQLYLILFILIGVVVVLIALIGLYFCKRHGKQKQFVSVIQVVGKNMDSVHITSPTSMTDGEGVEMGQTTTKKIAIMPASPTSIASPSSNEFDAVLVTPNGTDAEQGDTDNGDDDDDEEKSETTDGNDGGFAFPETKQRGMSDVEDMYDQTHITPGLVV